MMTSRSPDTIVAFFMWLIIIHTHTYTYLYSELFDTSLNSIVIDVN